MSLVGKGLTRHPQEVGQRNNGLAIVLWPKHCSGLASKSSDRFYHGTMANIYQIKGCTFIVKQNLCLWECVVSKQMVSSCRRSFTPALPQSVVHTVVLVYTKRLFLRNIFMPQRTRECLNSNVLILTYIPGGNKQ